MQFLLLTLLSAAIVIAGVVGYNILKLKLEPTTQSV